MFLYDDLKQIRPIEGEQVQCPINGCKKKVPRRHRGDRINDKRFLCPKHPIFISPSTFAYKEEKDNFLWNDEEESAFLNKIKGVKRETRRLGHENSEDAVTWNVFRYLERNNLLESYLTEISGKHQLNPEVIYWTYSKNEGRVWTPLENAWEKFEKYTPNHRTEPDLIIKTEDAVFFTEVKLNSGNDTEPSNQRVKEKYLANGWFLEVFNNSFDEIAVKAKKYQLMRMWLLGSWIARESNFYLLNLVSKKDGRRDEFSKFIKQSKHRIFAKKTWGDIQQLIKRSGGDPIEKGSILSYFKGKTAGYRGKVLQRAFEL